MRDGPSDQADRPSLDASGELPVLDQAILLAIAQRQPDTAPLSLEEERLLQDWIGGRLPPVDGVRAAELTKRNRFAAEHILEQRLIAASNTSPDVPGALAQRVIKANRTPSIRTDGRLGLRWPTFSRWQWSWIGGAVTVTIVIVAGAFQIWQAQWQSDRGSRVVMATIEDRRLLLERRTRLQSKVSSIRTSATLEGRYRDVEIPRILIRRAIASAANGSPSAEYSELMRYLRDPREPLDVPPLIFIDSDLRERLIEKPNERINVKVRVYDLDDTRTDKIRTSIPQVDVGRHSVFLTLGP